MSTGARGTGSGPPDRPRVIAHRGASHDEPEHTLAAYTRAFRDGADGLECDVRLTVDRHLVCIHDRRVSRTSNGRGIVSALELADLEGMDWGGWRHVEDGVPLADRSRVLTLRRLLTAALEVDRPLEVLIETKHPTRYAGLVERRLAALLTELGLDRPGEARHRVSPMSFSEIAVQRFRHLSPALDPVLLLGETVPLRFRDGSLPRGVKGVGLDVRILRRWPETVARQRARGHRVLVWTVDEPADVSRCLDLGVDDIITNRPRTVIDQIDRIG